MPGSNKLLLFPFCQSNWSPQLSEQKGVEMAEHKPFAEKGDQNYELFTAKKWIFNANKTWQTE